MVTPLSLVALLIAAVSAAAPSPPPPQAAVAPAGAPVATGPSYADLADLVIAAPVIADATIRSATLIKGAEATDVAAGRARFYAEADVTALVRGRGGIAPRIGYVVDVPLDLRGKLPKLKKQRVLLFARPVSGSPDQVQLVGTAAQLPWTVESDARVRRIAADLVASEAPPVITGIGNAFHVPGALPGEGETQIFLTTADNRPVSLSILRRPGEQPRWAVALSEIVDEAAAPPARDTLLWYRLACTLPATLPDRSTASLETADAAVAREDYGIVIAALGACRRSS